MTISATHPERAFSYIDGRRAVIAESAEIPERGTTVQTSARRARFFERLAPSWRRRWTFLRISSTAAAMKCSTSRRPRRVAVFRIPSGDSLREGLARTAAWCVSRL